MFIFALSCRINAEEPVKEDIGRHEIKLDVAFAAFYTLKVEYEYWLSEKGAFSFTASRDFSENPDVQSYVFASPKYYFYKFNVFPWIFIKSDFGYARGYNWDTQGRAENRRYHAFTVGFSGGIKKFYTETNTGLEIILGTSRFVGKRSSSCPDCNYDWVPYPSVNFVRRL
jgi:hypothetical protein